MGLRVQFVVTNSVSVLFNFQAKTVLHFPVNVNVSRTLTLGYEIKSFQVHASSVKHLTASLKLIIVLIIQRAVERAARSLTAVLAVCCKRVAQMKFLSENGPDASRADTGNSSISVKNCYSIFIFFLC